MSMEVDLKNVSPDDAKSVSKDVTGCQPVQPGLLMINSQEKILLEILSIDNELCEVKFSWHRNKEKKKTVNISHIETGLETGLLIAIKQINVPKESQDGFFKMLMS